MPRRGSLRSQRCQRCRRRKIKCDENWPSCTQCVRVNTPCSGPPRSMSRSASPRRSSHGSTISTASNYTELVPDAEAIRTDPSTVAERVAARLVRYLDKTSCYDCSQAACYLKLLPARLGESAALRDTVALFCSCWGSFRRAATAAILTPTQLIDPRDYQKAIRSLRRALSDPRQQLKCETLAAASILDRVEILFDAKLDKTSAPHAKGISGLMEHRGPPDPEDDLDVQLVLGNQATVLFAWLRQGSSNFFLKPDWREAMRRAIDENKTTAPPLLVEAYQIDMRFACWPQLTQDLQRLHLDSTSSHAVRAATATKLRDQALPLAAEIAQLGDDFMAEAVISGAIRHLPDTSGLSDTRLEFDSVDTLRRWLMYLCESITLNRTLADTALILNSPTTVFDVAVEQYCRQVCMGLDYMRALGPIARVIFNVPLSMALESAAGERERTVLLDAIVEFDGFRGGERVDAGELEGVVKRAARVMCGRATREDLRGDEELENRWGDAEVR